MDRSNSAIDAWPQELKFLALCASQSTHQERGGQPLQKLAANLDWHRVLDLAIAHGVAPLTARWLKTDAGACPDPVLGAFKSQAAEVAAANRLMLTQLKSLVAHLSAAGVPTISLKGPVLAIFAYGDLAARPCVDIDILVPTRDALRAIETVQDLGFAPTSDLSFRWRTSVVQTHREMEFVHRPTGVQLDLHWRLFYPGHRHSPNTEDLWCRAARKQVDGSDIHVLSAEDNLLYLSTHAAWHGWRCMRWLVDIAMLAGSPAGVNWQLVEERGKQLGIGCILRTSLAMCQRRLGLKLPHNVSRLIEADPRAQAALVEIDSRWMDPDLDQDQDVLPWRTLFARSLDSRSARARFWCESFVKPNAADWQFCYFPRPLWPLYCVIRPLRILTANKGKAFTRYFQRWR